MNLQFFRKHRKVFFVLMILAVFAMVTFGALGQLHDVINRLRGDPASKVVVLNIHGQDVTQGRRDEVRAYMQHVARQPELQQWILSRLFHIDARGAMIRGEAPTPDSAARAALILLIEAEQAGVALTEQLAEDQFNQLSPEDRSFLLSIFDGSREHVLTAVRMEFTLQRYLEKLSEAAKILPEDVDDFFRRLYQMAYITEVTIGSDKFVDQVPEPAAEVVQEQFQRYRDQLPEASPEGFGYMIPNRVVLEWIYMDAAEVARTVEVSDAEVEAFYLENRDSYVRLRPPAPADEAPQQGTEEPPGAAEPQEEPARQMNSPETPATENSADDEAAEPSATDAQPPAIIQSENNDLQVATEPTEPPVEYLPLDEVREVVVKDLREHRAVLIISEKMERAMRTLERAPAGLDFRFVAGDPEDDDEPQMHIAAISQPVTYAQAAELPGIGDAFQNRNGQAIPFANLALSVEPLQMGTGIFQNRPIGPLYDQDGSRYIFRITSVEHARAPDSIDDVRDRVVADVKRIEAQRLARARAEELVNEARDQQTPLAELAREAGLDVRTDVRKVLGYAGPESFEQLVMNAFTQETRFGTYATDDYARVIAFEVTGGEHVRQNLYEAFRALRTQQMLSQARQEIQYQALGVITRSFQDQRVPIGIDIVAMERRSNLRVLGPVDQGPQMVESDQAD